MGDDYFMKLALEEAKLAYERGDLPVGAVLTLDDKIISRGGNMATTKKDWVSHAEIIVLNQGAQALKENKESSSSLYTTWEPCFMCGFTAYMSRVKRIVYACPENVGGISLLDISLLPNWYGKRAPKIERGSFGRESYDLLVKHMEKNPDIWGETFLPKFREVEDSF